MRIFLFQNIFFVLLLLLFVQASIHNNNHNHFHHNNNQRWPFGLHAYLSVSPEFSDLYIHNI